jgi:hypothetical protein
MIGSNVLLGKAKKKVLYPVRNNAQLLSSGDENYTFSSEHGVQSPV